MTDWYNQTLSQLDDLEYIELPQFQVDTAWTIGNHARDIAVSEFASKSVVIDIRLTSGHVLFHTVTGSGATFDNDEWVRRKAQTVFRFGKSSFYWGQKLRLKGNTLEQNNYISEENYATHGGSIPIRVKGVTGVVGALTISGLAQEQDHELALKVLGKFA
ncbi:uncharacterized protein CANTADRAFT_93388 [Suhomyces tanzawaensis NRRL Y-17324]|uniref:DUF336-domain-containing protein n=1 Tax=Suhomyces tanzawaensis NRRL Y-17324 TaxID=984487 RepID=A0A1E4SRT3_9ASCO|nr:uncharacterized protein CANTADRAFT_93388 [Suhomyces tanzawaensis NRRL Y-17324]ODV82205.1 hypothetical protein CANTADRAFT_93388 [Suhomyces tanzawaensis NRRL Y-17324]